MCPIWRVRADARSNAAQRPPLLLSVFVIVSVSTRLGVPPTGGVKLHLGGQLCIPGVAVSGGSAHENSTPRDPKAVAR